VEAMRLCSNPSIRPAFERLLQLSEGSSITQSVDAMTWGYAAHVRTQIQHRLSDPEIEQLARHYRDGSTIKELAAKFRIHRNTVMALLEKSGVSRRGKGPSGPEVALAIELYQQGHSTAAIGSTLGFSGETIRQRILVAGVRTRSSHERHQ
jgi:hypothetical protein